MRVLLACCAFSGWCCGSAGAHDVELSEAAKGALRQALAAGASADLKSLQGAMPAIRVLERLPACDLAHIASSRMTSSGFSACELEALRRLAACIEHARGWASTLGLGIEAAFQAVSRNPDDIEVLFTQLCRRLEHPRLPAVLDGLATHSDPRLRAVAGKVLCLLSATDQGLGRVEDNWVVGRLRALTRDEDAQVASCLLPWVVSARQPLALKTLSELVGDSRTTVGKVEPILSPAGGSIAEGLRICLRGHFGLLDRGYRDRPAEYSDAALKEWLSRSSTDHSPYELQSGWVSTLDGRIIVAPGAPESLPSDLGRFVVSVRAHSVVFGADGPRVAYTLQLRNDPVGVIEDDQPGCLIGLEAGIDRTGPDTHEWRLRVVASPGPKPEQLRLRVRLWRRA